MAQISVIIPVYNASKYLKAAVDSIINQTFIDFELLLFNDGSTDDSLLILENYKSDPRVKIYNSTENKGLVERLNQGIELAKGKYIARMDADDICHPERFEKQIARMESDSDIALCGTGLYYIDEAGKTQGSQTMPLTHNELKTHLFFYTAILHPSVMVKTEIIKFFLYDKNYFPAEDYNIWNQIIEKYKACNLEDCLLYYRTHSDNITSSRAIQQKHMMQQVQKRLLANLGINTISSEEIESHYYTITAAYWGNTSKIKNKYQALLWLNNLYKLNNLHEVYEKTYFNECLKKCWISIKNNVITKYDFSFFKVLNSTFNKDLDTTFKIRIGDLFNTK